MTIAALTGATGILDLRTLPVAAFRTDRGGGYVCVSERWCELTALSEESALGSGWMETVHPDDRERVAAGWNAAIAGGSFFELDYRLRGEDGELRWVAAEAVALDSRDGEGTGYAGVIRDITARVAAEQELRRDNDELIAAREQLNAVLASLEQLVYTREFHADGSMSLVFLGPGLERLVGGETPASGDGAANWFNLVHPDDREAVIAATRDPHVNDGRSRVYRISGLDGITRWVSARTRMRRDETGRVLVDGIVSDVSEHVAREAKRQQFAALVEACADLIAITDLDARIAYLNPAGRSLAGLTVAGDLEELDLNLADLCTAETARHLRAEALPAVRESGSWRGEGQLRNLQNGTLSEVEVALFVLRDPITNRPSGLAAILRDVTTQRWLGEQLGASEAKQRTLVDSIGEIVYEATAEAGRLRSVFVSGGLEQVLGRALGDGEDGLRALDAAVHADDRAAARARERRALQGHPDSTELRVLRPDGEIRHLRITTRPRRRPDGQLTLSGVISDLSDHRHDLARRRSARAARRRIGVQGAELGRELTTRQVEILNLLGQGYNAPEIARRLTLSVSTVRNHSHAILRQLNVQTRAAALQRARDLGLIWAPPPS